MMGYIRHHAIVVTGGDYDGHPRIGQARQAAIDAGCALVTEVVGPGINGTYSFLVAPDGSKEWWAESDEGDAARGRFIGWLRDDEAHGYFDWAEISFSPDDREAVVERNAWDRQAEVT